MADLRFLPAVGRLTGMSGATVGLFTGLGGIPVGLFTGVSVSGLPGTGTGRTAAKKPGELNPLPGGRWKPEPKAGFTGALTGLLTELVNWLAELVKMALKAFPNAFPRLPNEFPKPGNCCWLLSVTRHVRRICQS